MTVLYFDEGEDENPEEQSCPYGFEFCENPDIRDMNLCTTDCNLYLADLEKEE